MDKWCRHHTTWFPIRVSQVKGTFWEKWPKTAWKLQNQHFWGKTVGDMRNKLIFWVVGGYSQSSPPQWGETLYRRSVGFDWQQRDITGWMLQICTWLFRQFSCLKTPFEWCHVHIFIYHPLEYKKQCLHQKIYFVLHEIHISNKPSTIQDMLVC